MRVLVCGDREYADRSHLFEVLDEVPVMVIIEGCARGADSLAEEYGASRRVDVEHYPANWEKHGRAAGPIRNEQMLREGKPDLVIAFHPNIGQSKGTADMVRRARAAGVPVRLYT